MRLIVNGKDREYLGPPTVSALLAEMGADPQRVAVAVNGEVNPRTERDSFRLGENDRVEVLAFCGGG